MQAGYTPLHSAAYCHFEVVRFLVQEAGADVHATNVSVALFTLLLLLLLRANRLHETTDWINQTSGKVSFECDC
jgi:hypothetical protein